MSNIPADLKYTKSHEWVRTLADGNVEVGITDHAQGALGDLVFVEVPEAGKTLKAGDAFAVVESVKAASDVYAPIAGAVIEGNAALGSQPELINSEPYGARLDRAHEAERRAAGPAERRRIPGASRRGGLTMPFIPHTPEDVEQMLAAIGAKKIEDLFDEIPKDLRIESLAGIPDALNEMQIGRLMIGARRAGRHAAQFHRRRRLRAPHSVRGVGRDHARRVLQRLHAVPGGSLAGHAAAHLRIPDDDYLADRHGRVERVAVRRRLGRRGSLAHGDPRAPQVEVAAHPRARPRCNPNYRKVAVATASGQGVRFEEMPCPKGFALGRGSRRSTRARTSPPS